MRRMITGPRAAAFLLLLAAALAGCGPSGPKLPKLAPGDVVLAFGDSLTFGTGASEAESYPAVLAGMIGVTVVRSGVPGEVSAEGLERLPDVLDEHRPRLLILCHGGNDQMRSLGDERLAANLRAMIRLAKERGVAVVLVGVPRPRVFADPPPLYEEIAREAGIPYEGGVLKGILYSPGKKSDPIHPNAEGYREMAGALAKLLKRAGAV